MIELIEQFNEERSAVEKPEVRIGIGIATGDVVAGYTGTQKRATYTWAGETVNLAARLEAHTKVARRSFLIDERTQRALKHRTSSGNLGAVKFQGRSAAADVFAVAIKQQSWRTSLSGSHRLHACRLITRVEGIKHQLTSQRRKNAWRRLLGLSVCHVFCRSTLVFGSFSCTAPDPVPEATPRTGDGIGRSLRELGTVSSDSCDRTAHGRTAC